MQLCWGAFQWAGMLSLMYVWWMILGINWGAWLIALEFGAGSSPRRMASSRPVATRRPSRVQTLWTAKPRTTAVTSRKMVTPLRIVAGGGGGGGGLLFVGGCTEQRRDTRQKSRRAGEVGGDISGRCGRAWAVVARTGPRARAREGQQEGEGGGGGGGGGGERRAGCAAGTGTKTWRALLHKRAVERARERGSARANLA